MGVAPISIASSGPQNFGTGHPLAAHPMLIRKYVTDDGECRLLLVQDQRLIAQIGLILEAGLQLAVAGPEIVEDCEYSVLQVLRAFLPTVLQNAHEAAAKAIRLQILESPAGDLLFPCEFEQLEFTLRARVESWTTSTAVQSRLADNSNCTPVVCEDFNAAELTDQELFTARVRQLIESILVNSRDLRLLPDPQAEALVADWSRDHCRITLATIPSPDVGYQLVDAGLIVVAPAADDDCGSPCLEIRYVGVRPELRAQGIASQMLSHVLERDREQGGVNLANPFSERIGPTRDSTSKSFQVWCDLENTSAIALYRRNGFQPGGIVQIWIRELEAADTSLPSAGTGTHSANQTG
jgi:ribosomal protein S18 acetylase RimI-like enzyme